MSTSNDLPLTTEAIRPRDMEWIDLKLQVEQGHPEAAIELIKRYQAHLDVLAYIEKQRRNDATKIAELEEKCNDTEQRYQELLEQGKDETRFFLKLLSSLGHKL